MELGKRFLRSLFSDRERRTAERRALPGLVAFYWDGGTPIAHDVQEISSTGLYLLTDQRWYPGTVIAMTLQWIPAKDSDPDRSIAVQVRAIRHGADGVGLAFVAAVELDPTHGWDKRNHAADKKTIDRFVARWFQNGPSQP